RCGLAVNPPLGVEASREIAAVYSRNSDGRVIKGDVARLFNGEQSAIPTKREEAIARFAGEVDFLLGGPPCQGHSDLNNHTRRTDPKNVLYLKMARAAEILKPRVVVIENVPPVQWDTGKVVPATENALRALG